MLLSNEDKTQNNDEFFTKCQYRENKKKIRNIGTIPTKNIIDRHLKFGMLFWDI